MEIKWYVNQLSSKEGSASTGRLYVIEDNPLARLPFEIQENMISDFYTPGKTSMAQNYIETVIIQNNQLDYLQRLLNDLYHYATRIGSHILCNNVMIILSQLPYKYLGSWADMLAVAATRSPYRDVKELGIRCFENWENKKSCFFLKECEFEENWLQGYADEVYAYVMQEGSDSNVLFEKNIAWEMAGRDSDNPSKSRRCFS